MGKSNAVNIVKYYPIRPKNPLVTNVHNTIAMVIKTHAHKYYPIRPKIP
jgi:hypothetical protein